MPKLIIKNGGRTGMEIDVTDGLLIGRMPEISLPLDDRKASRKHAKIHFDPPEWILVDLSSTNGTFLNGSRMTKASLNHGDRIRIGETVMLFHDPAEPAPIPEPPPAPRIDLGLPPPKKIKLDLPPPQVVKVKLKPTRTRRDRLK